MYFPSKLIYPLWSKTFNSHRRKISFLQDFQFAKRTYVTLLPSGNPCTKYCHNTRVTLTAQAKKIGALGTRIKIDHYSIFLNILLMCSAFRRSVCRKVFAWNFALRQWLPICTQIFSSLRAVFPFRLLYSFFTHWFLYCGATVPRLYQRGEKNNSSKTSLCIYFHYVI